MSLEELLIELRKLNRREKLKAVQVLVNELAAEEEGLLKDGGEYELLTPYGNEDAAGVLWNFLEMSH